MGIQQLPTGKFRVQDRRAGYAKYDKSFDTREAAEAAWAARLRLKEKATAADTTVREAWELYLESSDFDELAKNSQDAYKQKIQPALKELGDYSLAVLEDNTELVRRHFDKRRKTGGANETIRLEIASLSAVVKFAVARELIAQNFVAKVKRPKPTQRNRRVQPVEKAGLHMETLKGEATAQHARFNLLLGCLGCRPGELGAARKEDIDFAKNDLLIGPGKNGEARRVHLTDDAKTLLRSQLQHSLPDSPYIFNSRRKDGTPAPYRYNNGLRTLRRNNVVEATYHPHAMRREFISNAIENNVELPMLMKHTGHKSLQAIDIYNKALSTAAPARRLFDKLGEKQKKAILIETAKLAGATREQLKQMFGEDALEPADPFEEKKRRIRARVEG